MQLIIAAAQLHTICKVLRGTNGGDEESVCSNDELLLTVSPSSESGWTRALLMSNAETGILVGAKEVIDVSILFGIELVLCMCRENSGCSCHSYAVAGVERIGALFSQLLRLRLRMYWNPERLVSYVINEISKT